MTVAFSSRDHGGVTANTSPTLFAESINEVFPTNRKRIPTSCYRCAHARNKLATRNYRPILSGSGKSTVCRSSTQCFGARLLIKARKSRGPAGTFPRLIASRSQAYKQPQDNTEGLRFSIVHLAASHECVQLMRMKFERPSWVPIEPWEGFCEMRQRLRKPLTDRAKWMVVKRLEGLVAEGWGAGELLDYATEVSWNTVWPIPSQGLRMTQKQVDLRRALDVGRGPELPPRKLIQ
jgi:hypothetical protein